MGLDFIIIKKIVPGEEITLETEIDRFASRWYADLCLDIEDHLETIKMSGEYVYTDDQLILFGKLLIEEATRESMDCFEDYSEDRLLGLVDQRVGENLKLKLIAKLTTCSDEYYEEHFSKYYTNRLKLIAEICTSDILSEDDIKKIDSERIYCHQNNLDTETLKRLVYFGLGLIKYGNEGYMGFWSS